MIEFIDKARRGVQRDKTYPATWHATGVATLEATEHLLWTTTRFAVRTATGAVLRDTNERFR